MRNEHALVFLSGGQDSTTCLYWARKKFSQVSALSFDYGQKHRVELECAQKIAAQLGIEQKVLDVSFYKDLNANALSDATLPVTADGGFKNLPSTFVPGRNAFFLSVAVSYGIPRGIQHYVLGACETDFSGYPDCREEFVQSMQKAMSLAVDCTLQFHTPLMRLTKAQTFGLARELNCLDVVVNDTHTCYNGVRTERHAWGYGCGECPACVLRKKGFAEYLKGQNG